MESGSADASVTVKGIAKITPAPASPTEPIAVGSNHTALTDTRTPTDASVTAAKVAAALKPSGTAAAGDEALRALGSSASTAAAGNHAHSGMVTSSDITIIDVVTQAAYDALSPPVSTTLYVIVG